MRPFSRASGSLPDRTDQLLAGVLLALALAGCGTEPGPLAPLVGRWEATSMVLTSLDDPEVSADIVQDDRFSAIFSLEIESDGRYTATLTVYGDSKTERGMLEIDGDRLVFDPDAEDEPRYDARWQLDGNTLILDLETRFDFNRDGEKEPASLHIELVRT